MHHVSSNRRPAPEVPHVHYALPFIFPYLTSSMSCPILSQAGLLEVPLTYVGSLVYLLTRGPL
jgi:hypothetical protein